MTAGRVELSLLGQTLTVRTEAEPDYVRRLAAYLEERVLEIRTAGIKDPVVDRLIDLVIAAPDRPALVARTRALDRVLLWGHYVIPHWHLRTFRVVYWDKFARPAVSPSNTSANSDCPTWSPRARYAYHWTSPNSCCAVLSWGKAGCSRRYCRRYSDSLPVIDSLM